MEAHMNVLLGIALISAGALLLVATGRLVKWLVKTFPRFEGVDTSTSQQNLVVVGSMMVLAGLVFCVI
jgi:hypothetical protein